MDEVKEGGDADVSKSEFTGADRMRVTLLTHSIIEELKARRKSAAENEKTVEKLLNDRFTMGWKLDQECSKLATLNEKHESEKREIARNMEEKMKDAKVEVSRLQVYRTTAESEKEMLKEEIRRQQKKVNNYERQEKTHATQNEERIKQVTSFQKQHGRLETLISDLTTKLDHLEHNMKVVKDLNKRLHYQNVHQTCILDEKIEEIKKLNQELLDTSIKVKVTPEIVKLREEELSGEITLWKTQANQYEEEIETLCKDRDDWKHKYWDGLKQLSEAHRLLNVHLHNASQYRDEHLAEVDKNKQLQEQLDVTNSDLNKSIDEIKQLKIEYDNDMIAWNNQKVKLTTENESLNKELDTLKERHEASEVRLEGLTENIQDLEKKLSEAQAILNVDKSSIENQTELTMLSMVEDGIQITPDTESKELQTDVAMETKPTQTIDAAFSSIECQTEQETIVKVSSSEVGSQINVQTSHQTSQTEQLTTDTCLQNTGAQTVAVATHNADDIEDNGADIVDESTLDAKVNEELPRQGRNGNVLNVKNGKTGVSVETMEGGQGINCKSLQDFEGNDLDDGKVHDDSNFSPDRKKGLSCDQSDKDEQFIDDVDENGRNLERNPKNLKMKTRIERKEYDDLREDKINNEGMAVPVIDVSRIDWGVPVDPEEFNTSIDLSQDVSAGDVNKEGGSVAMEMSGRYQRMKSGVHSDQNNFEKSDKVCGSSESYIENKWMMSTGQSKAGKAKARKHKLAPENVDNHFYNFNQTKSRFETMTHGDDDDNDFQSKLPKLNKTHRSPSASISLKSKNFCAMFEKPSNSVNMENSNKETNLKSSNVSDSSTLAERKSNLKSSNISESSALEERKSKHPHTLHNLFSGRSLSLYEGFERTVSTNDGDSSSKSYKTLTSDSLTSSKTSTTTTTAGLKSGSLLPQSTDVSCLSETGSSISSINEAGSTTTNFSEAGSSITKYSEAGSSIASFSEAGSTISKVSETGTSESEMKKCSYYVNESNQEPDDDVMYSKTTRTNEVPEKNVSMSHNESSHCVDNTYKPDDKSNTKPVSNLDVLQKYKNIVAKLKTSRANTLPQVSSVSSSKSLLPSNQQEFMLDKGDHSDHTNNESCVTHIGILKDTKRRKKQTKNVSWFEYVAHKEYLPASPDDQDS